VPRVAATRAIAAPVDVVWAVFAGMANGRSWMSEVDKVEPLATAVEPLGMAVEPLAVGTAWRETRHDRDGRAVTEDLVVIAVDRGRCCTIGLAGAPRSPRLTYVFTPIAAGPHRGGTTVQVVVESEPAAGRRRQRIANQVLAFVVGAFAARTAEGALRADLDDLAAACARRVAPSRHRRAAA
jgi:hypothetical protein